MPLYEYRCTQCDHKFEKIQGYDAPEVMECAACKGEAVRMISRAAVQFKGSGFYSTDYGAKPGLPEPGSLEKSSDQKSSDGADTASAGEAKPQTKADIDKSSSPHDGSSSGSSSSAPAAPSSTPSSALSSSPAGPASSAGKN